MGETGKAAMEAFAKVFDGANGDFHFPGQFFWPGDAGGQVIKEGLEGAFFAEAGFE